MIIFGDNMVKKNIMIAITLGSVLGILEATLGYFFHLFSIIIPGIAGFFMFPIAFFIFSMAYKETKSFSIVMLTAIITAGIKLSNLFFPILLPVSTINPATSIILEAAAFLAFIKMTNTEKTSLKLGPAISVSLGWRVLFIVYLLLTNVNTGLMEGGALHFIRFILLDSFINGLLIAYALKLRWIFSWSITRVLQPAPLTTGLILCIALITEFFL